MVNVKGSRFTIFGSIYFFYLPGKTGRDQKPNPAINITFPPVIADRGRRDKDPPLRLYLNTPRILNEFIKPDQEIVPIGIVNGYEKIDHIQQD